MRSRGFVKSKKGLTPTNNPAIWTLASEPKLKDGTTKFCLYHAGNSSKSEQGANIVDSDDAECVLFNAMKVSQATISGYFDTLNTLASDENRAATVCYLLENGIAAEIDDAVGQSSDVSLFEGTVEDYACEYLEDCVFTKSPPDIFRNDFNVKSFARDLELSDAVDVV